MLTGGIACFNRGEYLHAERRLRTALEIGALSDERSPIDDRAVTLGGGPVSVVLPCYAIRVLVVRGHLDEAECIDVAVGGIDRVRNDPFSLAWALLNRTYVDDYCSGD